MLAVLLFAPPAAYGLDAIRAMPEETEEQRAAKGRALRELFERAAKAERFYRSPLNHVIGLVVNASLAVDPLLWIQARRAGAAHAHRRERDLGGADLDPSCRRARRSRGARQGLPVSQARLVFLGNGLGIAGSF